VKFCCADIDQVDPVTGVEFGLVEVRMRVFDDGNMTGFSRRKINRKYSMSTRRNFSM